MLEFGFEVSEGVFMLLLMGIFTVGPGNAFAVYLAPVLWLQLWYPPGLLLLLFIPIYMIPAFIVLVTYPWNIKDSIEMEGRTKDRIEFLWFWQVATWTSFAMFWTILISLMAHGY